MPETLICNSPEETRVWASKIAETLTPPSVICLYGELGAGKTVVAQAIAAALGVVEAVTSPTFTLINEYSLPDCNLLYHCDCYRLIDAEAEAIDLGIEDLYDQGILIIEWADRISTLLPQKRIDIFLEDAGPGRRQISIVDQRGIITPAVGCPTIAK